MATFNVIGKNTGFKKGSIQGTNMEEAENKCLEKGLDMYDQYMLIPAGGEIHEASPYINEILNR